MHQPQLKKKPNNNNNNKKHYFAHQNAYPGANSTKVKEGSLIYSALACFIAPQSCRLCPSKIGAGGMGKFSVMAFLIDN